MANYKSLKKIEIELVKMVSGEIIALCGWDGEVYHNSYECDENGKINGRDNLIMIPIYGFNEDDNDQIVAYDNNVFRR